jgi:hypothetical protein
MSEQQENIPEVEVSFLDIETEIPSQKMEEDNSIEGIAMQQQNEMLITAISRFEGGIDEIAQLIEQDIQDIKQFKEQDDMLPDLNNQVNPDEDVEEDPTAFIAGSVPGASLTGDLKDPEKGTLGKYPWETPPELPSPIDSLQYLLDKQSEPENNANLMKLLLAGIPVEAIARTATFMGYMEGLWTPDIAEIILTPLMLHLLADGIEAQVNPRIFNDIPDDGISQETVLELMEDFDPESLAVIEQDSQQERQTMLLEEEVDEEEEELAELEMGSFLDIEEEMPEMEVR